MSSSKIPLYRCENCGKAIWKQKDVFIGLLTVLCVSCAKQLLGDEKK